MPSIVRTTGGTIYVAHTHTRTPSAASFGATIPGRLSGSHALNNIFTSIQQPDQGHQSNCRLLSRLSSYGSSAARRRSKSGKCSRCSAPPRTRSSSKVISLSSLLTPTSRRYLSRPWYYAKHSRRRGGAGGGSACCVSLHQVNKQEPQIFSTIYCRRRCPDTIFTIRVQHKPTVEELSEDRTVGIPGLERPQNTLTSSMHEQHLSIPLS